MEKLLTPNFSRFISHNYISDKTFASTVLDIIFGSAELLKSDEFRPYSRML